MIIENDLKYKEVSFILRQNGKIKIEEGLLLEEDIELDRFLIQVESSQYIIKEKDILSDQEVIMYNMISDIYREVS